MKQSTVMVLIMLLCTACKPVRIAKPTCPPDPPMYASLRQLLVFTSLLNSFQLGANDSTFYQCYKNPECQKWVNETYDALSIEQRVAQFFMVAAYTEGEQFNMYDIEALAKQGRIGGVIFFKGHPSTQAYWTNRIQAVAALPLMIGIDGEWGPAMRLDSVPIFPRQLTLGAISDSYLIREMGKEIARECKLLGIHVNFAPVVDINSNPLNPVIGDRSFGEDKMRVALKGLEYADGLQQGGVMACAKHFPGHGDTDKDSHLTLPSVPKPLSKLEENELLPFKLLFENGVGSVMVAHLNVPALDATPKISASLSPKIIQKKLQQEMGFNGLVFSDALNMKGVSQDYAPGTVDSIAFMAGNDILLYSLNAKLGVDKIADAWKKGKLEENYMEARVKKVLAYKYMLGLKEFVPFETSDLITQLNSDSARALRNLLFQKAITIAANEENVLPITKPAEKKLAALSIDCKSVSDFQKHCQQFAEIDLFNAANESQAQLNPLLEKLSDYQRVIVDVHGMSRSAAKNYGLAESTINIIQQLNKRTEVVLVLFGTPYALKYFDELKTIVVAYEDNDATQLAAANAIFGGIAVTGKLPVTASKKYVCGNGYLIEKPTRLQLADPEDVGMKTEDLRELDEVVLNAMIAHAFPGCQIAVVKNNKLIWNKAYGAKTYEQSKDKVLTSDLYDLASISKIAATTLAVMKLYEEKKINLQKTVSDYLELDDSATIRKIKLADLLTHQAGLKAFIEFFRNTIDSNTTRYYRTSPQANFTIQVAESLYLRSDYPDSMWHIMAHSSVKTDRGYLYSDIDFYILQKVVEKITGEPLDVYVHKTFYEPLGLTRMGYQPLKRFPAERLLPTEHDKLFRKQVVRGYVHDPGAAMYGGVAGHAGVFSNAVDLAQIMQLLLNKGSYNGQRIFSDSTVLYFTKQYSPKSRRGLGFDKQEPDSKKTSPCYEGAPVSVFGHTGFTGTCVWSDPENQLTFIFLSNRVYPDADNNKLVRMNVRSQLQKIVYNAIKKK